MAHTKLKFRPKLSGRLFGSFALLAIAAGCGGDGEPSWYALGPAQFEFTGTVQKHHDCNFVWAPVDMHKVEAGAGGRNYKPVEAWCGHTRGPRISVDIRLWQRDDGSFPSLQEGAYPVVRSLESCSEERSVCITADYRHDPLSNWDSTEGTLTISEMSRRHLAGTLDAKMAEFGGELPPRTLHVTGNFDAERSH